VVTLRDGRIEKDERRAPVGKPVEAAQSTA
jgi:hypothetical protein